MAKTSPITKIEELFKLYQDGHISEEEFKMLKEKAISESVPDADRQAAPEKESVEPSHKEDSAKTTKSTQSNKKARNIALIAIGGIILILLAGGIYWKFFRAEESGSDSKKDADELLIEGSNIWVRDYPSTGEVVMKLNTGDKCEVLEKGEFEEIRDMYDYWYKIEFDGQEGWVYGSQTDRKTEYTYSEALERGLVAEKVREKPKSNTIRDFCQNYLDQSSTISRFIHPSIKLLKLNNPGVMCFSNQINSVYIQDLEIPSGNVFSGIPYGGHCDGYENSKDGFYYETISSSNLPDYTDDGVNIEELSVPYSYSRYDIIKLCIIRYEGWVADFYFIEIEGKVYLICQDYCDCSG